MDAAPREMINAEFALEGEDLSFRSRVAIPKGPTNVSELLPLARALADAVVRETCKALNDAGESVSCKAGCGACCNNLVAISEVEARRIAQVISEMPEPRRTVVRERFTTAKRQFEQAGLLKKLKHSDRWTDQEYGEMVGAYFAVGVPCPFLEDGSCSIYEERPITCREYLVTSPPENCAEIGSEGVRRVRLPLRVFNAVARWQVPPLQHIVERWIPLILAPDWAELHPQEPPPKDGPELLRELLEHLSGKIP